MKYYCKTCNIDLDKHLDKNTSKSTFTSYKKCKICWKTVCLNCQNHQDFCIKTISIKCNCADPCDCTNETITTKKSHTYILIET